MPSLTSVFLHFYLSLSLFFSFSLSQYLFHSLPQNIVSFDFYLKTATGNTCRVSKNLNIPKGGKLFDSEEKEGE